MVTANTNDFDEDLAAIDKRAIDLMAEFEDHYQDTLLYSSELRAETGSVRAGSLAMVPSG